MTGDVSGKYSAKYFNVTFPRDYVAHVEINRAEKLNAFYQAYVGPYTIHLSSLPRAHALN
jgi:delta(3,5)-delta(2,4)-dienoyl-CoA isomerase